MRGVFPDAGSVGRSEFYFDPLHQALQPPTLPGHTAANKIVGQAADAWASQPSRQRLINQIAELVRAFERANPFNQVTDHSV